MQFQSLSNIKINGQLVFLKVISHVSAILGLNPYTGKVELKQESVIIKENELNCNLEKSSSFLSFGGFNNCNVTFNVSIKYTCFKMSQRKLYVIIICYYGNKIAYCHVFFLLYEYAD